MVGNRDLGERATAEHEVDAAASFHPSRTKASPSHLLFEQISTIARACEVGGPTMPVLAARLAGVLLAANCIAQEARQPCIGTGRTPTAGRLGVEVVHQTRAARTVTIPGLLTHQLGVLH